MREKGKAKREIKFRYIYQHKETGRIMRKQVTLTDIEGGATKTGRAWWSWTAPSTLARTR